MFKRSSGVLAHVTSLPSPHGVGTMGRTACEFIDFLADAHQTYWQVLPLGHTGFGDSPYQCFSAAAGNPYLIDMDLLVEDGLLTADEVRQGDFDASPDTADFEQLADTRWPLFRKAYSRVTPEMREEIAAFTEKNSEWLPDYALFMALKEEKYHHMPVYMWPDKDVRDRKPAALEKVTAELRDEVDFRIFLQYIFFKQWTALREYANEKGIQIIGDIPIFVSMDSADVWANQHLFQLDSKGYPTRVAGVPPDYFSATGQLWGNPLYNWEAHEAEHFSWWISRIRAQLYNLDILRVDHFRGFEAFWSIPYGEPTAVNGEWVKAAGHALFSAVRDAFEGNLPIIAEDLGIITPEVEALRDEFGFPGMKVLQFAFDSLDEGSYLPHRYTSPVCVCYTGTHDNDTTRSWYQTLRPECRDKVRRYTHCSNDTHFPLDLIGTALASVAAYAIFPLQDVLCVGAEGRMNTPGIGAGNWSWRYQQSALKGELADELRGMTILYGRY